MGKFNELVEGGYDGMHSIKLWLTEIDVVRNFKINNM